MTDETESPARSVPAFNFAVALALVMTCYSPARAHGPGHEEIDLISHQLAESGERAVLYAKRARIYQDNQMWRQAMADFDRAAALDAKNAGFDLERAGLSYAAGQYLRALDFINLYLLRHANSIEAALIQARSLRALGQHAQAIASYRTALAHLADFVGSPPPEWYLEFADTLQLAGDKIGALQALQQGIDRLGPLSVFQLKSAELEVKLGDYDKALARIDQILNRAQRKDLWLARRADILASAGRADEARQTYEQAYAALRRLPARLQNLPVSRELATSLQRHIDQP